MDDASIFKDKEVTALSDTEEHAIEGQDVSCKCQSSCVFSNRG